MGILYSNDMGSCMYVHDIIIYDARCKGTTQQKKKLLPFVPIILIGIYAISYIAKIQALRLIAGDMTSVICQLVMISITCCMWSGLIPVNTGYEQFLMAAR